jgi:hypothetical protein
MVGRHGPRSTCPLPRVPAPHAHWRSQGRELWSGGTRSRSPWPRQNPPGPPSLGGGGQGPASPCPPAPEDVQVRDAADAARWVPSLSCTLRASTICLCRPDASSAQPGARRDASIAGRAARLPTGSCLVPSCRWLASLSSWSCGGHTRLPLLPPRPAPLLTHRSIRPLRAITLTERGRPVNTAIRRASVLLEGTVGA